MEAPAESAGSSQFIRNELLDAARRAALRSYSPYSRFRVGAAVLTADGVFTGANIENASYGLCLCAERAAISGAVAAGAREIQALAVSCIDAPKDSSSTAELMPCGACRQWMAELAPRATVFVDGVARSFSVADLLPDAFVLPSDKR